jgi:hypothetical protein
MGVYKVDAASGLCGKADQQSRKNVENFLKKRWKYGEKWLTETEAYNIITQCDVVRDTLANSPGDGIYQRFRTFPQ